MARVSTLIDRINSPIIACTIQVNNYLAYESLPNLITGISSVKLKNGVLIRNFGHGDVLIYNETAKNRTREISIIPDESIFIQITDINNIQIKTNSAIGSLVGILANWGKKING